MHFAPSFKITLELLIFKTYAFLKSTDCLKAKIQLLFFSGRSLQSTISDENALIGKAELF